jgi:O-antigen/teichoic acid export membrane protein
VLKFIHKFFNTGHERTIRTKKNILGIFFLKGISIAISFVIVPVTIQYIGPYQYGIWVTISSLVAWLSFFDIGFSGGLKNKFIESIAANNTKLARTYVSTTYAILGLIIGIVWILAAVISFFLNWNVILNIPKEEIDGLTFVVLIALTNFCYQFILRIIVTLLNAIQKPAIASLFDTLSQLLNAILIILLIQFTTGSLINLVLVMSISGLTVLGLGNLYFYLHDLRSYRPSIKLVDFSISKDIMSLGIKFFLLQIVSIVIYQTNNVIITNVLGPLDVTVYNIAYKYMYVISMIYAIILTPFWSAFVEANSRNDYIWMKKATANLRLLFLAICGLGLLMVFISPLFYKYWIRETVKIPWIITFLMLIYHITNIWGSLHTQLLAGFGKIKLQVIFSMICGIINIPIVITLCRLWGLQGIVLGNIFVFILFGSWFGFIQVNKLLNKSAKGIWNE